MNKIKATVFFSSLIHYSLFIIHYSSAQVPVVKFDYLEKIMYSTNDTTYVINFWATWCAPCVKELPYFKKLNDDSQGKKIKVILVSMDFKKDVHSRVEPFVTKNNIKNPVVLLDEPDYNSWIDKVDTSWSGGIPATLICEGNVKKFYQKDFTTYFDLENIVKPFLK